MIGFLSAEPKKALRDNIDREIRAQGSGGGNAGTLGPYQDKLILIANAITTQNDSTFSTSVDRNEGIGAYFSWRRDSTAYSPTNTDGLLLSTSATDQLNVTYDNTQNFVNGFGHLNFLKGYFHSDSAANTHTIHGHKPSSDTSAIDEIPLIRLNNGEIEYNRSGIRGTSQADQDWVAVQTSQGNDAGYVPGSALTIVWEENIWNGSSVSKWRSFRLYRFKRTIQGICHWLSHGQSVCGVREFQGSQDCRTEYVQPDIRH